MDVCRLSQKKVSQISQKISASFRISGILVPKPRPSPRSAQGRASRRPSPLARPAASGASLCFKRLQKKELERSTMWKMGKIH